MLDIGLLFWASQGSLARRIMSEAGLMITALTLLSSENKIERKTNFQAVGQLTLGAKPPREEEKKFAKIVK
jgi:hypothetical protein